MPAAAAATLTASPTWTPSLSASAVPRTMPGSCAVTPRPSPSGTATVRPRSSIEPLCRRPASSAAPVPPGWMPRTSTPANSFAVDSISCP
ncbi:MAG: hypothetical protein U0802_24345 [Candidatus Binatia bacterium]